MPTPVTPFVPAADAAAWAALRARLAGTRWPEGAPEGAAAGGLPPGLVRELCAWWREGFDWPAAVGAMGRFGHFTIDLEAARIHFLHERGRGPRPLPLLLTHGWPGSFLEMARVIPLLTDPAAHGGAAEDAFDVVVPSLPGFGFSGAPRRGGMGYRGIAALWAELMAALGYERFGAQGGDIGAGVATALGLAYPERVVGLHLNYIPASYCPPTEAQAGFGPAEEAYLRALAAWQASDGAYAAIQATRPLTLAYALQDSPAGLAAWMVEKFQAWSDCDGDVYRRFSRDDLLATVTLYWVTGTVYSSLRVYEENRAAPLQFAPGERVGAPTAVAVFPREISHPPRAFVERGYNLARWTEMPRGGHFAAWEEPELLAADVRAFFRPLRGAAGGG
jgi:pimeloyl-ACP methyl ester carboxylesterase